jgi:hypothetical protein
MKSPNKQFIGGDFTFRHGIFQLENILLDSELTGTMAEMMMISVLKLMPLDDTSRTWMNLLDATT